MKTLTLTTAIGLILCIPAAVMASPEEDITIRVMEMNEDNARQQMMNLIPLPEFANQEAREQAMKKSRERITEREHNGVGESQVDRELADEMERDSGMEQDIVDNDIPAGPRD